jgi:hypothetical protein
MVVMSTNGMVQLREFPTLIPDIEILRDLLMKEGVIRCGIDQYEVVIQHKCKFALNHYYGIIFHNLTIPSHFIHLPKDHFHSYMREHAQCWFVQ